MTQTQFPERPTHVVARVRPYVAAGEERLQRFVQRVTLDLAVRWLSKSAMIAAILAILIARFALWRDPQSWTFVPVVDYAVGALLVVSGIVAALRIGRVSARLQQGPAVSWLLSLDLGILLSVGAAALLVRHVPEEAITGWNLPLLNKQWLIALYNLSILVVLVFPAIFERLRTAPDGEAISVPRRRKRGWLATWLGVLGISAVCWYFAGPPWHLDRHHRPFDWHEQLQVGPMQAMSKGYLPYIGPASMTYGPGTELLLYGGMRAQRHFDLVSFRAGWAAFHLTAVLALGISAYFWMGIIPAIAVILLAMGYSSLSFYYTIADGTFAGFYGWANPLRYIAPVIVAPTLARLVVRQSKPIGFVLLGVIWGLGAWLAQENLTTTAAALTLTVTLLWSTRTVSIEAAMRSAAYLVLGFAIVASPVLLFYAWHGEALGFLRAYLFFAKATVAGFANIWWPPQDVVPDVYAYYYTLPFVLTLGVLALWSARPCRLAAHLDERRALFLALICVQCACFQTALLRSDSSHVLMTLIALPFLLVMAVTDLPRWVASAAGGRLIVRVVVAILALAVYPTLRARSWGDLITAPLAKYKHESAQPPISYEGRVAYKRVTSRLTNEPELAGGSRLTMQQFLDFSMQVHEIIGNRKTYVGPLYFADAGALLFLAGLNPAPYPTPLTVNDEVRRVVAEHIRAHPAEYECFVGATLDLVEARAFIAAHPGAVTKQLMAGRFDAFIVLAAD